MARVLIENFPHRPGGHCASTALRDMLKFYGHSFTEDMVFGLGAGIGFSYYRHPELKPPVYIGGRTRDLEKNLCRNLGVGLEIISGLDNQEGWREVKMMLDQGIPAMVHVDVYYLDYLRAKRHFSGHRVILVGYDEEEGIAFVADNDRDEIQKCSLRSLELARSAAYLPLPADNTFYRFQVPSRLFPVERAIQEAMMEAVEFNLRLPPSRSNFEYGGAKVSLGLAGLAGFSGEMTGWPQVMDNETLSLLCKSLYVSIEKGGTGYGGNFRRIYGRFLVESEEFLGDRRLQEIGRRFIDIGDLWTDLSFIFREFSHLGKDAVDKAYPLALDIYDRERRAFMSLERIVHSPEEAVP